MVEMASVDHLARRSMTRPPARRPTPPRARPSETAGRARRCERHPRSRPGARSSERSSAQRAEEALRGVGHERMQQNGDHAQPLGQPVEDLIEASALCLVLRQLPRLLVLDVAVEEPDAPPDLVESQGRLHAVEPIATAPARPSNSVTSSPAGSAGATVAVAAGHRERPAREVAVLVRQLGRVARLEPFGRDLAVLANRTSRMA